MYSLCIPSSKDVLHASRYDDVLVLPAFISSVSPKAGCLILNVQVLTLLDGQAHSFMLYFLQSQLNLNMIQCIDKRRCVGHE